MIGKFNRKTLEITGLDDFNSKHFLRRLQKSSIKAGLNIVVNGRTKILLSVFDKSILRESNVQLKFNIIKNLLEGCSCEESIQPFFDTEYSLIHVIGSPIVGENQIEELVAKLLDIEVNSCIFVNLSPVIASGAECPFRVSFSVAISGHEPDEKKKNISTIASVIQALYDKNSIRLVIDRKPSKNIKKLAAGGHIYSTILDLDSTSAYFQFPLTYGIEPVTKMRFPVPNNPFTGIEIGEPAEFKIPEIDKARIKPEKLFTHMAVWGASGTGKTTFIKNLLINLEKTDIKFCVLDWHNEYRSIVPALNGQLGKDTIILNPLLNSLSINPLEIFDSKTPKHIQIWERIENFISIMKQMFILGEIQEAKLRQALSSLYGGTNCPIISEAIIFMSENRMKSLTMKLDKFTKDFYGQIFNRRYSSLSFSELRQKNVIIELGQLPSEVRMFFACVFLILWWDSLRIMDPSPNVLVLDDFYRYANLEIIRKMLSEARKFKQGLICSHQGPYQLPPGIREEVVRNTATKVIFRQEQTWDKHIVRDALGGLTKDQLIQLSYLKIGQAIIKIPDVNFPIRISAPLPPKTKKMFDWEVERSMKDFTGKVEPYEEPRFEKSLEIKFLVEIQKNPEKPLTEITKLLGIKTQRGYDLKNKLVKEGLLEEDKIRKGIGRPRVVLRLTKRGLEYIDIKNTNAPQYGKSEHLFMKNKIASILKDWKIKVEDGCDIRAEKNGYKFAIEVETGKSNDKKQIIYNLDRNIKWADQVVIICPNKQIKVNITELLGARAQDVVIVTYIEINNLPEILFSFL